MKPKQFSTEELEQMLADRKADERKEYDRKKTDYERRKDALINNLGNKAVEANEMLLDFKLKSMADISEFRKQLLEYGDLRGGEKNKGNFEIKNDLFKISFSSQVNKTFDERSELAEAKLKSFLSGFVKKRDKELYSLIIGLLERNHVTGALDISNINRLYKLEDKFDNEDWKDAIRLFKESYNPESTTYYARFSRKNEQGGWESINLNFSSI